MTVQLPEYVGIGSADWAQVDNITTFGQATVGADGTASVAFAEVPGDRQWRVTRAAIECSVAVTPEPQLRVYAVPSGQPVNARYLRSGTDRGMYDEADYPDDGLIVREAEGLVFTWAGAPVGATVTATVQYNLMGH